MSGWALNSTRTHPRTVYEHSPLEEVSFGSCILIPEIPRKSWGVCSIQELATLTNQMSLFCSCSLTVSEEIFKSYGKKECFLRQRYFKSHKR